MECCGVNEISGGGGGEYTDGSQSLSWLQVYVQQCTLIPKSLHELCHVGHFSTEKKHIIYLEENLKIIAS